ncbi:MAG: tRNA threonylcarbamoyladenosine dehydratase [Limisphaerales bacterium]
MNPPTAQFTDEAYTARFSGIQRLYGTREQSTLRQAHVCIIGIGGVGSWTVEALARTGIGSLTLIDLDEVCISNTNRQIHAVQGASGQPKVEVMARRAQAINPACNIKPIQQFFTASTAETLLATRFSCVVDAIDQVPQKTLLLAECHSRNIPVVTVGGAGGRRDPARIKTSDLALATHDRLLQEVRRRLRREHMFPAPNSPFGIPSVFSDEPQIFPTAEGGVSCERQANQDLRLDCHSGYGTATFVTGTFGFAAAALAVNLILQTPTQPTPPPK